MVSEHASCAHAWWLRFSNPCAADNYYIVEYMTSISGQTDAPEVRYGLTDTQTVTLTAHAQRGFNIHNNG